MLTIKFITITGNAQPNKLGVVFFMKTPIWIEQETYDGYKALLEKHFNGDVTEDQIQQYFRELLDTDLKRLKLLEDSKDASR